MPPETDGYVAVVKPHYAEEEAYRMGFDRFETADPIRDGEEPDASADVMGNYRQGAQWANNVAPGLRAMAGYADGGHGTYQEGRKVAAVHPGAEEDEPAEADLIRANDLYSELIDAFDRGAYDALHGNERGESLDG